MTAPSLPRNGAERSETKLLAQLGLPPSASPEDVDEQHLAVSQYLAAAPASIRGWAHAQAAALDSAYLSLTDPVGLEGSALRSPASSPAVVPGGPATPPARRDSAPAVPAAAVAAVVTTTAPEAEADVADETPDTADDADLDDLSALYASVTPSAHPDMAPSKKERAKARARANAEAKAAAAAAAAPVAKPAGRGKRIAAVAAVAVVAVVGIAAVYNAGASNAGNAPAASAIAQQTAPAVDASKIASLMATLSADPKNTDTLLAIATEYYAGEQYTDAKTFLDKVLAIDPANVKALLASGAIAFNTGDNAAAKAEWDKVIAVEPDNQEVHYDLGFMYLNQTKPDWAGVQTEWQKVVDIDPTTDLAKTVQSHLDALAKSSMLPGASGAPGASPAASPAASADPAASPAAVAPATTAVTVSAKNLAYNTAALSAPADTAFTITFDNQEDGLPHDVQLTDASGTVVFKGDLVTGPTTVTYNVPALKAGTYTFSCSIHPTMTGTLTVGS